MKLGLSSLLSPVGLLEAVCFGLCWETAGAGGGGGGAPAGGSAAADATAGPDGADGGDPAGGVADDGQADPARATAGEPDDEGDDSLDDVDLAEHLPEPQVRTRLRRTQRANQRMRPIADRFRGPDGKFLPEAEVDRLLSNAREFESVDAVLRRSPKAVQTLLDEQRRLAEGRDEAAHADDTPEPFNEAEWEFETDTPAGKRLLAMAKQNHELVGQVKQLQKGFTSHTQTVTQRERQREEQHLEEQWKGLTFDAAKEIAAEEYRPLFVQAVYNQFQALRAAGQLTKANAKEVIDKLLAPIRGKNKQTTRQSLTRASATVAGNGKLPVTPRPGTTAPASGDKTGNHRETLKDASKSFLSRYKH